MFVYKENRYLMRREQITTGRNGEKLDVGSTSIGGSNTITINNTNKDSLTSEGVKQTSVAVGCVIRAFGAIYFGNISK